MPSIYLLNKLVALQSIIQENNSTQTTEEIPWLEYLFKPTQKISLNWTRKYMRKCKQSLHELLKIWMKKKIFELEMIKLLLKKTLK